MFLAVCKIASAAKSGKEKENKTNEGSCETELFVYTIKFLYKIQTKHNNVDRQESLQIKNTFTIR